MIQLSDLSRRRREVAELVGDGKPYKVIAATLGIEVATAKVHVYEIADKIGRDDSGPYIIVMRWVLSQRKAA